ncbi:succinate--CoA ligase subunit alpha [Candidatus Woesearchaeota archaeon]|nr:succinate--CoA ligase subunit alpha [Candidatus Woesearchaeota archaeon]
MSILIDKNTKVIVQGITGKQGSFHTKQMLNYGTKIVAGVTPGKQGQTIDGIPVYNTVKEALVQHNTNNKNPIKFSIIFVPVRFAKQAAIEALENNLNIILITEGIPIHDTLEIIKEAKHKDLIVIGPNCPGIISPEESKLGIMPNQIFKKGKIGIVSRSGTLTYEIVHLLSSNNIGQSSVIGIGGDSVIGFDFVEALKRFEQDQGTEKIILIGEIGGNLEEQAAKFIKNDITKPVIAYIAGKTAPLGKKMGHAGAIITRDAGTATSKIKALQQAGVKIAELPSNILDFL